MSSPQDCQREVEAATDRVKRDLAASVLECNAILEPLEPPPLPPKAEGEAEEEEDEAKLLDELEDLPMDGTIDPAKAKAVAAENAARKALRVLGERTEGEVRGILAALEAQDTHHAANELTFALCSVDCNRHIVPHDRKGRRA